MKSEAEDDFFMYYMEKIRLNEEPMLTREMRKRRRRTEYLCYLIISVVAFLFVLLFRASTSFNIDFRFLILSALIILLIMAVVIVSKKARKTGIY